MEIESFNTDSREDEQSTQQGEEVAAVKQTDTEVTVAEESPDVLQQGAESEFLSVVQLENAATLDHARVDEAPTDTTGFPAPQDEYESGPTQHIEEIASPSPADTGEAFTEAADSSTKGNGGEDNQDTVEQVPISAFSDDSDSLYSDDEEQPVTTKSRQQPAGQEGSILQPSAAQVEREDLEPHAGPTDRTVAWDTFKRHSYGADGALLPFGGRSGGSPREAGSVLRRDRSHFGAGHPSRPDRHLARGKDDKPMYPRSTLRRELADDDDDQPSQNGRTAASDQIDSESQLSASPASGASVTQQAITWDELNSLQLDDDEDVVLSDTGHTIADGLESAAEVESPSYEILGEATDRPESRLSSLYGDDEDFSAFSEENADPNWPLPSEYPQASPCNVTSEDSPPSDSEDELDFWTDMKLPESQKKLERLYRHADSRNARDPRKALVMKRMAFKFRNMDGPGWGPPRKYTASGVACPNPKAAAAWGLAASCQYYGEMKKFRNLFHQTRDAEAYAREWCNTVQETNLRLTGEMDDLQTNLTQARQQCDSEVRQNRLYKLQWDKMHPLAMIELERREKIEGYGEEGATKEKGTQTEGTQTGSTQPEEVQIAAMAQADHSYQGLNVPPGRDAATQTGSLAAVTPPIWSPQSSRLQIAHIQLPPDFADRHRVARHIAEFVNESHLRLCPAIAAVLTETDVDTLLGSGDTTWPEFVAALGQRGYVFRPDHLCLEVERFIREVLIRGVPDAVLQYNRQYWGVEETMLRNLREIGDLQHQVDGLQELYDNMMQGEMYDPIAKPAETQAGAHRLHESETRVDAGELQLQATEEKIKAVEGERQKLREESVAQQVEIEKLRGAVEEATNAYEYHTDTDEALAQQIALHGIEVRDMEQEMEKAEVRHKAEISAAAAKAAQNEMQIEELENTLKDMADQMESKCDTASAETIATQAEKIDELDAIVKDMANQLREARADGALSDTDRDHAKKIDGLETALKDCEAHGNRLTILSIAVRKENDQLKLSYGNALTEIRGLGETKQQLEAELARARDDVTNVLAQADQHSQAHAQAQRAQQASAAETECIRGELGRSQKLLTELMAWLKKDDKSGESTLSSALLPLASPMAQSPAESQHALSLQADTPSAVPRADRWAVREKMMRNVGRYNKMRDHYAHSIEYEQKAKWGLSARVMMVAA